ncbi:MAG: ATP-binding protein [candidate division Zixibacteria bacterium]|nr:ATP-binding protein [candidate division Zixibacteria bacterium]
MINSALIQGNGLYDMNKGIVTSEEPALAMFESLNSFKAIQNLIDEGESENQYIECKAPTSPKLGRDTKSQLSRAVSGFANTGGGVIIWGVSTTRHKHSSLDILSQIEAIGSVKKFAQEIDLSIPVLIGPNTLKQRPSKIIYKKSKDTKGIVITYITPTSGDPVQANDGKFYLRIRDEFKEMPFETIKRMFSGSASSDLYPNFDDSIVKLEDDGSWSVPVAIENKSSVAAKEITVSLRIENFSACETVSCSSFYDASDVNPGKKLFIVELKSPIHRGLNQIVGRLSVKMKKKKRMKRILNLEISLYASNMRARKRYVSIQLAKTGFSVKSTKDEFLY